MIPRLSGTEREDTWKLKGMGEYKEILMLLVKILVCVGVSWISNERRV